MSLVILLGLGALAWPGMKKTPSAPAPSVSASAPPPIANSTRDGGLELEFDASLALAAAELSDDDPLLAYSGWSTWPDGGAVPPLPPTAPIAVRFGAVLFPYAGAEFAPPDAPTRDVARSEAEAVLEIAKQDFKKAVKLGHGGGEDLGLMRREVLEPPVEYALFTLKVGSVYPHPVDTPRGYWVIRRVR
ncbi:MAG: hypothetical protein H6718_25295 [Polyangiaceae bacterium]|nr:hypothetical protein [Polyangiaceae bacterium]MCB9605309.1 hypothetical protein [Polyangiaceae bacterium]